MKTVKATAPQAAKNGGYFRFGKYMEYTDFMSKEISVEAAVELALKAQESRIESVREAAEARAQLTKLREENERTLAELKAELDASEKEAARADLRSYNAAISAGWSADELRKFGIDEPGVKARAKRKPRAQKAAAETPVPAPETSVGAAPQTWGN